MIVYHVTTRKKFLKYLENGGIKPPIRAWIDIQEAERFAMQTGRRIILRLRVPDGMPILNGHKGMAVVYDKVYCLDEC